MIGSIQLSKGFNNERDAWKAYIKRNALNPSINEKIFVRSFQNQENVLDFYEGKNENEVSLVCFC